MDVKTAFLNGDLREDIYMVQPPGFIERGEVKEFKLGFENCELHKLIKEYGLAFLQSASLQYGFYTVLHTPACHKQ
ncbi:hypothetical protein ACFX2F_043150 [Malus domestica]